MRRARTAVVAQQLLDNADCFGQIVSYVVRTHNPDVFTNWRLTSAAFLDAWVNHCKERAWLDIWPARFEYELAKRRIPEFSDMSTNYGGRWLEFMRSSTV